MIKNMDKEALRTMLLALPAEQAPLWGMMHPQHMIEHLEEFVMISTGQIPSTVVVPAEMLPRFREALFSNAGFMKNVGARPDSAPKPLRHADIPMAVEQLFQAMDAFKAYYQAQPEAKHTHLYFGELDEQEWRWFHHKHFSHHLAQFGLLPEW